MLRFIKITGFAILIPLAVASAQSRQIPATWDAQRLTQPFHFDQLQQQTDRDDVGIVAGGTAGVLIALGVDDHVRSFVKDHRSRFADNLFVIDSYYGNPLYTAPALLGIYLLGGAVKHSQFKNTSSQALEAYMGTLALTAIIKVTFGRSRPYTGNGPFRFRLFSFHRDNRSFFSGHASTTFAVSTVMAAQNDNIVWKTGWFASALLVGTARIYHDQHWLSDVLAGSLAGFFIGQMVLN